MDLQHAERRRSDRIPASNPVTLRRPSGGMIAHCRASNISETGMLAVVRREEQIGIGEEMIIEISPKTGGGDRLAPPCVFRCRVVRIIRGGNLMGLGLQFLPPADE